MKRKRGRKNLVFYNSIMSYINEMERKKTFIFSTAQKTFVHKRNVITIKDKKEQYLKDKM